MRTDEILQTTFISIPVNDTDKAINATSAMLGQLLMILFEKGVITHREALCIDSARDKELKG